MKERNISCPFFIFFPLLPFSAPVLLLQMMMMEKKKKKYPSLSHTSASQQQLAQEEGK
jgi:hypothetical protein